MPSSESVLADPLLFESNDFTPSTRSSTSESISDSSPLPTREAQSNIAADIKVILAGQGKRVTILRLVSKQHVVSIKETGEKRISIRSTITLNADILLHSLCKHSGTLYNFHKPLRLLLQFISGSDFNKIHKSMYKYKSVYKNCTDTQSGMP